MHSLGGIFVAPFLIVAALTGLAYAIAPTLENIVYKEQFQASSAAPAHSVAEQVAVAQKEHPELTLNAVQVEEGATTRVLFSDPALPSASYRQAVFVDPGDLSIAGDLPQYGSSAAMPLRAWLSEGHANLWLGKPGRIYSELAASWMGALTIGGLLLWWGRRRSLTREKAARSPRLRQMRSHSRWGIALAGVFLFLTATGLTWSTYAGENIGAVRTAMNWKAPKPASEIDGNATDIVAIDQVLVMAREEGLSRRIEARVPSEAGEAWTVREARQPWRFDLDTVTIDPANNAIVDKVDFSEWPLAAKLTEWTINAHMGFLFGWVNQLLLVLTAVALIIVTVRGYMMWYLRGRGRSFGRMAAPVRWRDIRPGVAVGIAVVVVAYAVVAPLWGVSLLAFAVLDGLWRLVRRGRDGRGAAGEGAAADEVATMDVVTDDAEAEAGRAKV